MNVIRFDEAERYEPEPNWRRTSLCSGNKLSIEHFVKPAGHASRMHAHPEAQVLVVLKGKLSVCNDKNESQTLTAGDCVYLRENEQHSVTNPLSEPSEGLDIFAPGRSFDFWKKRL